MSRKYTLKNLVSWGHIADYEEKKLIALGFTDVDYEDRMSVISNVNKAINYQFYTDRSRRGFMTYSLSRINPYEDLTYNTKARYSLWQCIKKYEEIIANDNR